MKFRYVSLFSGAGGLDIGLERAGLKPVSLCEIEHNFCETLKQNQGVKHSDGNTYLRGAKVINADIRDVSHRDLKFGEKIDLVVGGPPCQAFSSSGKQRSVLDPRGALVNEFYRIVDEVKPRMFLFENVRGLVTARDKNGEPGGVIKQLIEELENIGYSCRASLLNSADFGSFQRRVRCFIVGSRRGTAPMFPEPEFEKGGGLFRSCWNSLSDFLHNYEDTNEDNYTYPTPALAEQFQDIPNGSGIKSAGRVEATRPGGHWGYRQGTFIADLTLPARTVTGSASQDWIRWNGNLRRLTFSEVKLLQGFPVDWRVEGTKAQQFKQIGNAVPAVFGESIGAVIRQHLKSFPKEKPKKIPLPKSFHNSISYTKRDHARNKKSRSVHLQFANNDNDKN